MVKQYKYKDQIYQSAYSVRQAIWNIDRKIFPKEPTENVVEFWNKLGVEYSEVQPTYTDEQLAERARIKRDRLLSSSDFYVMADYPSTQQGLEDVKIYRQTLRDITSQEGFPKDIIWPQKPSVLGEEDE